MDVYLPIANLSVNGLVIVALGALTGILSGLIFPERCPEFAWRATLVLGMVMAPGLIFLAMSSASSNAASGCSLRKAARKSTRSLPPRQA